MFVEPAGVAEPIVEAQAIATPRREPATVGVVATRLAEALAQGDVIYVAADEQRAEMVATALAVAAPDAEVLHCPSSDALPGDTSPASPANVGRRVAALHRARAASLAGERRTALVTTAEGAARLYPPVEAFDASLPRLAVGEPFEIEAFDALLRDLGYFADERVDEPGEIAIRGQVVDIFPADAGLPARIELAEGRIAAIRCYDPVTQLGTGEIERLEIGRSAEPPLGDAPVTLFDHLPGAAVALDPEGARLRDRFVGLVADAVRLRPGVRVEPVADAARWSAALAGRTMVDVAQDGETAGKRFVEGRAPLRAFGKAVKAALSAGDRTILAGSARDLRFLATQLRRLVGRVSARQPAWRCCRCRSSAAGSGRGSASSPPQTCSAAGR